MLSEAWMTAIPGVMLNGGTLARGYLLVAGRLEHVGEWETMLKESAARLEAMGRQGQTMEMLGALQNARSWGTTQTVFSPLPAGLDGMTTCGSAALIQLA